MQSEFLPRKVKLDEVDQCVYGRDYRKTTQIWNDVIGWSPCGYTGDGKCRGRCGKGRMHRGFFKHFKALAMEPIRGPRGKGHNKEKNALPVDLLREFAQRALDELPKNCLLYTSDAADE